MSGCKKCLAGDANGIPVGLGNRRGQPSRQHPVLTRPRLRYNTDRRIHHRLAHLAVAITLIITIKLIDRSIHGNPSIRQSAQPLRLHRPGAFRDVEAIGIPTSAQRPTPRTPRRMGHLSPLHKGPQPRPGHIGSSNPNPQQPTDGVPHPTRIS